MFGEFETLRCTAKSLREDLLVARTDIEMQSVLRKEFLKQVFAKLMKLREVQFQLERRDGKLTA